MANDKDTIKQFERVEDFVSAYANNVRYEATVWDLKLIFGQLDQSQPGLSVEQHTAITLSWPVAKITAYFLTINLLVNQVRTGLQVQIPADMVPPRPDPAEGGWGNTDPRFIKYLGWIHDQFFSGTPFVPPEIEDK